MTEELKLVSEEQAKNKKDLINRLNRIEGQLRGIQRMVQEEADCADILTQIAAVRSATNKVGGLILEKYAKECVRKSMKEHGKDQEIEHLNSIIQKFLKYVD